MESQESDRSQSQNSMIIEESQIDVNQALPHILPNSSLRIYCPKCHRFSMTKITLKSGSLTWLGCSVAFLSGCMFGCCVLPFFTPYLKDIVHECGICGNKIGICARL